MKDEEKIRARGISEELFGKRLKVARVVRGISQKALAEGLGVSLNTISRYETGKRKPSHPSVLLLSQLLGVAVDYFSETDEGQAMEMLKREIRIPEGARRLKPDDTTLPLLGAVPAGDLQEAIEDATESFPCTKGHARVADFVLRVKGDSMYPTLQDGDFVAVKSQPTAESGQLVVARINGEVGVKIYRRDSRGERLESANPLYPPILGGVEILGVVVWMHRNLRGGSDLVED